MAFLRAHAFMLSLVAAVIVPGGAMMAAKIIVSADVGELVERRTKLSSTLKSLKSKPMVNAKVLARETQRVERNRAAARQAIDLDIKWNRGEHKVLQLTYPLETGEMKTIDAFPIQRDEYEGYSLIYVFTRTYQEELAALLADLEATQAPTPKEVEAEISRVERKLLAKKAAEERRNRGATGISSDLPRKAPSPGMTEIPPEEYYKGSMMGLDKGLGRLGSRKGAVSASSEITAKANTEGLASIRLKKAKMGRIYADMDSFANRVFDRAKSEADDATLWQAQVHLWVAGEVVGAIRETNDQVLAKLPENRRNVIGAPVKRFVSLQVDPDYYIGTGKSKKKAASGTGGMKAMPMDKMGGYMDKMGGYGMMQPGAHKVSRPSATSELTQRACCKDYDVVRYNFTVVMPMRYLQDLLLNLLKRNNHTILNVSIDRAVAAAGSGRSGGQSYYYYGTDPVVEVTVACELLLMTAWERGTYDSEQKKWSDEFPPLMPVAVLQNIGELLPDALRKEDRDRVAQKL